VSLRVPTRTDLEAIAEDVRRLAPGAPYSEVVQGVRFVVQPPTPLLERTITRLGEVLRDVIEASSRSGLVERATPLMAGTDSVVVPDIVVRGDDAGSWEVEMVVLVRGESTDRYALGPKRLAFQTAGIGEYWFLDPLRRTLSVMALDRRTGMYEWPPETYGPASAVPVPGFSPGEIRVDDVLDVGWTQRRRPRPMVCQVVSEPA
jgi:Uma2 family endonuclease